MIRVFSLCLCVFLTFPAHAVDLNKLFGGSKEEPKQELPQDPEVYDPFGEGDAVNCAEQAINLAREAGPAIMEAIGQLRNGEFVSVRGIENNQALIEKASAYINAGCDDFTLQQAIDGVKKPKKKMFGFF